MILKPSLILPALLALAAIPPPVAAQTTVTVTVHTPGQPLTVIPHMRPIPWTPPIQPLPTPAPRPVEVSTIDAKVRIDGIHAETSLTVRLDNPESRLQESIILLPIPPGATVKFLELDGAQGKLQAKLLPKDEARRTYDDIVRRTLDPALLEFAGTGLIQTSVFPVPARGTASVRITYEEILPAGAEPDGRIDYYLPRSESADSSIPWTIHLTWKLPGGHAGLYSHTHPVEVRKPTPDTASLTLSGQIAAGPFRLSALPAKPDALAGGIFLHPGENGDDGTFLMLLAPPPATEADTIPREVTVVIDRSGSMAGEKMDQTRAAALQIVEALADGERFNLITYNETVTTLFDTPRPKDPETTRAAREFIAGIRVSGGTNIHGSLLKALEPAPTPGFLHVVLFMTDGIPTIGETGEKAIRDAAKAANANHRRIFTFGVGADVNTPLLSRLADDSRATPTYVLPSEDVELKVVGVFRRLAGPLVESPAITVTRPDGTPAPAAVTDVAPAVLPDFFAGELQVVLGRYTTKDPVKLIIRGKKSGGRETETIITLDPAQATIAHAHVPRLWATRRIATLTEALRDLGATSRPGAPPAVSPHDPRVTELVDEIVRLSLRYGVMTEYTSFLALETTPLANTDALRREAQSNAIRSNRIRSGNAALSQEWNNDRAKNATVVEKSQTLMEGRNLAQNQISGVQCIGDKTFYQRNGAWIDSEATNPSGPPPVDITIGSPAFHALVDRLVASNRQSALALGKNTLINDAGHTYRIIR
jgi:Ca-activated chloride channel family protein